MTPRTLPNTAIPVTKGAHRAASRLLAALAQWRKARQTRRILLGLSARQRYDVGLASNDITPTHVPWDATRGPWCL